MLNEISGYDSLEEIVSVSNLEEFNKKIDLNINDVSKKLGINIEKEVIDDIFTNLGFAYTYSNEVYTVTPPSRRNDISIKEDLIPANIPTMDFTWTQRINRHEEGKMFEEQNSGVYYKFLGGDVDNLSETTKDKENFSDKFKWVSFKNQFFSSVLIADKQFTGAKMSSTPFEKGTSLYQDYLKDVSI